MNYSYDLQYIKENLSIEDIEEVLIEFGGEPTRKGDILISRTICHNHPGEGTFKLYFYSNSNLFHCFTDCGESFDVFELTRKFMSREHPKAREDGTWNLPEAVEYIARKFGYAPNIEEDENDISIRQDLTILQNYDRIKEINVNTQQIELKEYDGSFLNNLPHVLIEPWIKDNISKEIMDYYEICYNPQSCGIIIPHRDINGRLVGIRERTLILENIEKYGKYRPAYIKGQLFTHPLSYNLYGLYQNKNSIKQMEKAFIFESEKSVLQYATMFGQENNLACGICGSSFLNYQAWLLIQLGVKEIIIGLDRQYKEIGDNEYQKLIKNLKNIHNKYGKYIKISYLFDKENILSYKSSPTDEGKEKFLYLYENRINLY